MGRKVVIVGSGAAGMTAASAARKLDEDSEITVFTEEEHVAYSPCAIPFVLEGKIDSFDSIVMHDPEFYKNQRRIDIHVKEKITSIDAEKRTVSSGLATYPYDSLVLATGGKVFVPPIEGVNLKGVFKIRYLSDGVALQKAMRHAKSAAIAGAGIIGLEMAVALRHAGLSVTVVEMFPQVIPRICDADIASRIQAYCENAGIEFVLSAPIGSIKGKEKVEAVTAGGRDHECDLVVMATGVRPNLELPNAIDLDLSPLGAVRVAPSLQPYRKGRLMKDVFLAGDLVTCESAAVPGPTMSQLGSTAVRQGRVAGINAAGGCATFPSVVGPWVSQIGEVQVAGAGLSGGLAEYYGVKVIEGRAEGSTRARYYPGGKELVVKLLVDVGTHKIVGGQMFGGEDITGRINWISAAIFKQASIEEFVAGFENAYCPPTSRVKDVVVSAAEDAASKL